MVVPPIRQGGTLDPKTRTQRGTVLQVTAQAERFPGCFVVVEDVRSWGVRGYIPNAQDTSTIIPVRVSWHDVVYVGEAGWIWQE